MRFTIFTYFTLLFIVGFVGCTTTQRRPPRIRPQANQVKNYFSLVSRVAAKHGVPETLVMGVIQVESSFNPNARSRVGARGLMQLMPRTAELIARRLKIEDYEIEDPEFNVQAGTAFLASLLTLFKGDVRFALAGYNTGPARALRWKREGKELPRSIDSYVRSVLSAQQQFDTALAKGDLQISTGGEMAVSWPSDRVNKLRHEPSLDRQSLLELIREKRRLYDAIGEESLLTFPARDTKEGEDGLSQPLKSASTENTKSRSFSQKAATKSPEESSTKTSEDASTKSPEESSTKTSEEPSGNKAAADVIPNVKPSMKDSDGPPDRIPQF